MKNSTSDPKAPNAGDKQMELSTNFDTDMRQQALAKSLIDTVGYTDAAAFCRNSYWDGVLSWVLAIQAEDRTGMEN